MGRLRRLAVRYAEPLKVFRRDGVHEPIVGSQLDSRGQSVACEKFLDELRAQRVGVGMAFLEGLVALCILIWGIGLDWIHLKLITDASCGGTFALASVFTFGWYLWNAEPDMGVDDERATSVYKFDDKPTPGFTPGRRYKRVSQAGVTALRAIEHVPFVDKTSDDRRREGAQDDEDLGHILER